MTDRRPGTAGATEFSFDDGEYADDAALLFCGRCDVEQQTPVLMAHFGDSGMEVRAGKPGKDSKSEILLCSAPSRMYGDATTLRQRRPLGRAAAGRPLDAGRLQSEPFTI